MKPVLRYAGSKYRIAPWIARQLPPHESYVEPFAGSLTVLFAKPRSLVETVNDLDQRVVTFFRVVRDQPEDLARALALTPWSRAEYYQSFDDETGNDLEDARRFAVRCWQAHSARTVRRSGWVNAQSGAGGLPKSITWTDLPERILAVTERLRGVQIECQPAIEVIARFRHEDVVIYADPPYVQHLRTPDQYRHELTNGEHTELLAALDAHPGPVLLSGYQSAEYDARLAHWRRSDTYATAHGGARRVESLWLNPVAVARLGAMQSTLNGMADSMTLTAPVRP